MIYAIALAIVLFAVALGRVRAARSRGLALIIFGVALAGVPLFVRNDASINTLADIGIYVLLALGLNITVGFAGLLDLGYAAFFSIGAYAYGMLASAQFNIHLPFWGLLFIGAGLAALFGFVLGAPTLRLHGDYLAIVTLGFGLIVPQIFQNLTAYTGGPNGISGLDTPSFFGHSFGQSAVPFYYVVLGLVAVIIVLVNNLRQSRLGRAWMAIREDPLAAKHVGINTTGVQIAAFAFGAAIAGLAGVIFAAKLSLVSPDLFTYQTSILVLSMVVLGGMGNIPGVVVGAVLLALVNTSLLPQINGVVNGALHTHLDLTNFNFFIYGAILVALMLFRPEGLLPNRERQQELHASEAPAEA